MENLSEFENPWKFLLSKSLVTTAVRDTLPLHYFLYQQHFAHGRTPRVDKCPLYCILKNLNKTTFRSGQASCVVTADQHHTCQAIKIAWLLHWSCLI